MSGVLRFRPLRSAGSPINDLQRAVGGPYPRHRVGIATETNRAPAAYEPGQAGEGGGIVRRFARSVAATATAIFVYAWYFVIAAVVLTILVQLWWYFWPFGHFWRFSRKYSIDVATYPRPELPSHLRVLTPYELEEYYPPQPAHFWRNIKIARTMARRNQTPGALLMLTNHAHRAVLHSFSWELAKYLASNLSSRCYVTWIDAAEVDRMNLNREHLEFALHKMGQFVIVVTDIDRMSVSMGLMFSQLLDDMSPYKGSVFIFTLTARYPVSAMAPQHNYGRTAELVLNEAWKADMDIRHRAAIIARLTVNSVVVQAGERPKQFVRAHPKQAEVAAVSDEPAEQTATKAKRRKPMDADAFHQQLLKEDEDDDDDSYLADVEDDDWLTTNRESRPSKQKPATPAEPEPAPRRKSSRVSKAADQAPAAAAPPAPAPPRKSSRVSKAADEAPAAPPARPRKSSRVSKAADEAPAAPPARPRKSSRVSKAADEEPAAPPAPAPPRKSSRASKAADEAGAPPTTPAPAPATPPPTPSAPLRRPSRIESKAATPDDDGYRSDFKRSPFDID